MEILSKEKAPRAYITITDPSTKKSVSVTISGATRDQVAARLREIFGQPTKPKPVAA